MRTHWYPLRLSTPIAAHVFGGRAIADRLGRRGLPGGRIAETWEVSDVEGSGCTVLDGPLAGRTLRELTREHPEELVGGGWRGDVFPLLTKFIDATGMLPVHLHADDATAQRLEGQPNGKTEAWHVLEAVPGATAYIGVRRGVDRDTLRDALLDEDFDSVMRTLPVRPGDTIYIPGGTLHSFGPSTVIYEIEQTSNIQQHAMPWNMEDGSAVEPDQRRANIERLLDEWEPHARPHPTPGLRLPLTTDSDRLLCCAGPYFALERWRLAARTSLEHVVDRALILSNAGAPTRLETPDWAGELGPAETLLLPAVLGRIVLTGPADLLVGYLPDHDRDIRQPLLAAGYAPEVIAALGGGQEGAGPGTSIPARVPPGTPGPGVRSAFRRRRGSRCP
ncbi:mannose-6-phosphate isomerase [Saccharopolyspora kobensis]|uniref:Mannose-6-phosphate isomerase n=1 Tax=Saccharopolyspora kobensis TaxID=146035 RepID=A0A1H5VM47_9PSEU|nr:class I mannose-6-phosphate isomerase [Saccharopolyspora kobensis]SEF87948.1 mannose-6-phosphate isomerase [Saccharopolyspora kobensis]SFC59715.1 mannose-6-phosphate isomerase [Saccharopolyspora kobensis]